MPILLPSLANKASQLQQAAETKFTSLSLADASLTANLFSNFPEATDIIAIETCIKPDDKEYTVVDSLVNTVGIVIQKENRKEVIYNSEDNQHSPEITEKEYLFFSTTNTNIFKYRTAIAVDSIIYTNQFDFQKVLATVFFRFPERNYSAIILSFCLPCSIEHEDNKAQQDCYML